MTVKKKYLFLLLCLLLLVVPASANIYNFSVNVLTQPAYYVITFHPPDTVIWYSVNSSVNYADVSWVLYGTNDELFFNPLDEQNHIALVADTVQAFPLDSCNGSYAYYYFQLTSGFTDPAAWFNFSFNTSGVAPTRVTLTPVSKRAPVINRVAAMGIVMGGVVVFVIVNDRKRRKKDGEQT